MAERIREWGMGILRRAAAMMSGRPRSPAGDDRTDSQSSQAGTTGSMFALAGL